jgi:hypothetical protein
MRSIALGLFCVAALGCGADSTVNGVFPSSGFLGRTMRVEITGDNTNWGSGTKVDFGQGVTVSSVNVASPTSLFADITISDSAAAGLRDVLVTGGEGGALHNAFDLQSPLEVSWQGTPTQGSVVLFTIRNLDFGSPFDDTCTAGSILGCNEYGNLNAEGPPGTYVSLDSVSPYTVSGAMFVDIDATPGDLQILSGAPDQTPVISPLGATLDIPARTATALTSPTTTTTVAAPYDSHLYSVESIANSMERVSTSTEGTAPTLFILGATGHFEDIIDSGKAPNAVTAAGGTMYIVAANLGGDSGFAYTLRASDLQLASLPEADTSGANDTAATAQNLGSMVPALVTGASVSATTDQDWYKFAVPANSAAKKVHVITMAGDPYADEAVAIYAKGSTGTAPGTQIGGADDGYHEDVISDDPLGAATTVWVKISTDPKYYNDQQTHYMAVIFLE